VELLNRFRSAKRTTIYDLAALSGSSASAVSAVLNGNWKKRRISQQTAEKITKLAEEHGYALNMQASVLRKERSKIIGMLVPKYDNRYFGSIAEQFEGMARERGLFPIITCTRRDPELELEAARAMLSYQVDCLIATGATDPDRIADICLAAGVPTINLDLPGSNAPSVISDNYLGAFNLTQKVLANCETDVGSKEPLLFVGGRAHDHNTRERLRGFQDAHQQAGIKLDGDLILTCGYAPDKAERAMEQFEAQRDTMPKGLFVNSTISLEGVMRWIKRSDHYNDGVPHLGCFDWDPFVAMLGDHIAMVRQDVPKMLEAVFNLYDSGDLEPAVIQIPPTNVITN
jgi:LacI family fructose operon transcriptional repressor